VLTGNDSERCCTYGHGVEWNIRRLTSSLVQSRFVLGYPVCPGHRRSEPISHTSITELDVERHAPCQILRRYLSGPIRC
jgi:hypothetical protein